MLIVKSSNYLYQCVKHEIPILSDMCFAFLHFINEWCGFSNLCCMFVCVCAFEIYKDINTRYVSCDPLKKQSVFSIFPYVLIFPFSSKDLHAFKLQKKSFKRNRVFTFSPNIQQDKIWNVMVKMKLDIQVDKINKTFWHEK